MDGPDIVLTAYAGGRKLVEVFKGTSDAFYSSSEGSSNALEFAGEVFLWSGGKTFIFGDPAVNGEAMLKEIRFEDSETRYVFAYSSAPGYEHEVESITSYEGEEEEDEISINYASHRVDEIIYPNGTIEKFTYDGNELTGVIEKYNDGATTRVINHIEWAEGAVSNLPETVSLLDPDNPMETLAAYAYVWDAGELAEFTDNGVEYTVTRTEGEDWSQIDTTSSLGETSRIRIDVGVEEDVNRITQSVLDDTTVLRKFTIDVDQDTGRILAASAGDDAPIVAEYAAPLGGSDATNLKKLIYPSNRFVELEYDDANDPELPTEVGLFEAAATISEIREVYTFDAEGRPLTTTSTGIGAQSITTSFAYDGDGRLDTVTDGAQRVTSYDYDAENLKATVTVGGREWEVTFDDLGRVERSEDASGQASTFEYHPVTGNLLAAVGDESDAPHTTFDFLYSRENLGDDLEFVEDPENRRDGYQYDDLGRLYRAFKNEGVGSNPSSSAPLQIDYEHPNSSLPDHITTPNGHFIDFTNDLAGQVKTIEYWKETGKTNFHGSVAFDYHTSGAIDDIETRYDSPTGTPITQDLQYNVDGDVTLQGSLFGGAFSYDYDGVGRLASVTVPDAVGSAGHEIEFTYKGSLPYGTISDAGSAWMTYEESGLPAYLVRGGINDGSPDDAMARVAFTEYRYHGPGSTHAGNLDVIRHKWRPSLFGPPELKYDYAYDVNDRIDLMTIGKAVPSGVEDLLVAYGYDDLGRLDEEYGQAGEAAVYYRAYQYDDAGNRTQMVVGEETKVWTYVVDDYNFLTQRYRGTSWATATERERYLHDQAKNLVERIRQFPNGDGYDEVERWEYDWNALGQMTGATKYLNGSGSHSGRVEYRYAVYPSDQRTERIEYNSSDAVTSWVRYENDGLLVYRVDERYDGDEDGIDASDPWRERERRTYGQQILGNLLYKEVLTYPSPHSAAAPDSKVFAYHYDAQGSVVLVTEQYCSGNGLAFTFHHDAFGNRLNVPGFEGDDWHEAAEAGVTEHLFGKDWDPFTGYYFFHSRWYDPGVGRFVSPTGYPNYLEGSYLFCENDPINMVDLNGKYPWWIRRLENVSNSLNGAIDGLTFDTLTFRYYFIDESLLDRSSACYQYGYYGGVGAGLGLASSGLAAGWSAYGISYTASRYVARYSSQAIAIPLPQVTINALNGRLAERSAALVNPYVIEPKVRLYIQGGIAQYRYPDILSHSQRIVGDVKFRPKIDLSPQLRDLILYAQTYGYEFQLMTIPNASLSKPLAEALKRCHFTRMELP